MVATWTQTSGGNEQWIEKTITGCTAGQPIIIAAVSSVVTSDVWTVHFKVKSGATMATSPSSRGFPLGVTTYVDRQSGGASYVIIPTATSVTIQLYDVDNDETVYIYRAG